MVFGSGSSGMWSRYWDDEGLEEVRRELERRGALTSEGLSSALGVAGGQATARLHALELLGEARSAEDDDGMLTWTRASVDD